MVLTAGQTTAFFTDANQMGLTARTRGYLQTEGISMIEDLLEFSSKDSWTQIVENCKRPPQVTDAAGNLVNQAAFHIGAKSLHRLQVAAIAVEYYAATDRTITPQAMQWDTTLKNFEVQWKAIKAAKDGDTPEAPKMSKTVGIVKWLEAYENYSKNRIGDRYAPLAYVIRENVAVPAAPTLQAGQPHSEMHGSVKEEMIARLSHTHGLFRDDNASVFDDIEVATRGTKFAPTIAPFKRTRNGRGAFLALKKQHAGAAMWDKEVRECQDFLLNRKWTGGTNLTLDRFLSQHRAAYVSLQRCAENVQAEVPNERTRVKYLIDNIQSSDSDVKAALAAIKLDDNPTGMRNDFEAAVAFLLPVDPVKNKQKKRPSAEISATGGKTSKGPKTGVELRYYTPKEFAKLSPDMITELKELRSAKKGKGNNDKSPGGKKTAKFRQSLVKACLKELREEEEQKQEEKSAIEAISGILKLRSSAVAGGDTKNPAQAQSPIGKKRVTIKDEHADDEQVEVAATKLFQLMNSRGGRHGDKGGKGN
eukprot:scaffold303339_cov89-Cyclotella_meneghiniana.AAC.1